MGRSEKSKVRGRRRATTGGTGSEREQAEVAAGRQAGLHSPDEGGDVSTAHQLLKDSGGQGREQQQLLVDLLRKRAG